jgi:hemoglobin-like flavoprotein
MRKIMNVEILRASFAMVDNREPPLAAQLYDTLFSRYPQVRPLFGRNSPHTQQRMLHQALVAILDHLEDAFWLEEALKKYGARHADYGVTEEMYDWFGECLLATLAEIKGTTWTPQLAAAWADAYRVISGFMKEGAKVGNSIR